MYNLIPTDMNDKHTITPDAENAIKNIREKGNHLLAAIQELYTDGSRRDSALLAKAQVDIVAAVSAAVAAVERPYHGC